MYSLLLTFLDSSWKCSLYCWSKTKAISSKLQ